MPSRRTLLRSTTLALLATGAVSMAPPPKASPQGVPNRFWSWRGFDVRYQQLGRQDAPPLLLVHGLFVNADHWRKNLPALADAGFCVYAIDLLGYGYSSKPSPTSAEARAISGERNRNLGAPVHELGTAQGGRRVAAVDESHPLGSPYNFYTWSEQLVDFVQEVAGGGKPCTLVANSIGSISALQAAIDKPELFNGIAIVNPNFRELHTAEQPALLQPITSAVQAALRRYGQPLFDALAKPATVKSILNEPYADSSAVTDELVDVLLQPLLTPGSADVVFDTLSYSAGPLPEVQLADIRLPVLVCYGELDPWTPAARVRALERFESVIRVECVAGAGHCPHDESPSEVNPILVDFARGLAAQLESECV